jgi:hypothetical protein
MVAFRRAVALASACFILGVVLLALPTLFPILFPSSTPTQADYDRVVRRLTPRTARSSWIGLRRSATSPHGGAHPSRSRCSCMPMYVPYPALGGRVSTATHRLASASSPVPPSSRESPSTLTSLDETDVPTGPGARPLTTLTALVCSSLSAASPCTSLASCLADLELRC